MDRPCPINLLNVFRVSSRDSCRSPFCHWLHRSVISPACTIGQCALGYHSIFHILRNVYFKIWTRTIPYGRARFAHPPGKIHLFKRLPTPCTGRQSIIFGIAQIFSQPLDFVLSGCLMLFCPNFQLQGAEPAHSLTLPKILHTLKKIVQGPCTPCCQSILDESSATVRYCRPTA